MFKQAIALGWDCPRASILMIFRESKSFTFTIQTIGRIMRMPELRYYTNESELNKGFIFTNLLNIMITEDYAKDYLSLYESKRRSELYRNIDVKSIYIKKQTERMRLSVEFPKIFINLATKRMITDKITTKPSKIINPIIADGKIVNIDKIGEVDRSGTVAINLNDKETTISLINSLMQIIPPFTPRDSSDRIKRGFMSVYRR